MNARLSIGLLAVLAADIGLSAPMSEQKSWTQSYQVSAATPKLLISNVWGTVRVRAGSAGEIAVTVDERRSAPTPELFERSKQSLYLDVQADQDGVSLVVGGPPERQQHQRCRGCRVDYQFEVAVPPGTQVDVSTVDDGRIDVTGVSGLVSASNVNGPVAASGLHDCAQIESVNGAVDLAFADAPSQDCNIETINGDIALVMPAGAGLDASLSMVRGSIVSEFDLEPLALPAKIERGRRDQRDIYRIQQAAGVRLGAGGPTFNIASLNGDVRIRKNTVSRQP
jgi:hypothetical protein